MRGRRWLQWWRQRRAGERGSMSVEIAIIAPGLMLLLLLVVAAGRVVEVQGHIDGAARDAARAASLGQSPGQADQLAQQAAEGDLGSSSFCSAGTVQSAVSGFPADGAAAVGQDVTVVVRCDVNMSPFRLLGFGPTKQFTGSAVAPLDTFTCRSAVAC